MKRSDRTCGHKFIVASTCDQCRIYIEEQRAKHKRKTKRRRVPPFRQCVICGGNERRTWTTHYQCAACLAEREARK